MRYLPPANKSFFFLTHLALWMGGMIQSGDGIRASWRNKALSRRLAEEKTRFVCFPPRDSSSSFPPFLHAWLTRNEREHKARKSPRNSCGNYPSRPPLPYLAGAAGGSSRTEGETNFNSTRRYT